MNPGVYHDMLSVEYHSIPALSAGGLKRLSQSPLHFWAAHLDPDRLPSVPTPAMQAGTLAHCALLEPHTLAQRYITRPDGFDGRTKDGKAWLAAVPEGVEAVAVEQMQTAQRQAAAVRALPEIAKLLSNGRTEVSVVATDDETGVLLKARPDLLSPVGDGYVITDLKTTKNASANDFQRSVVTYRYAMQVVHYSEVVEKATGKEVLGFVFACVESDPPHAAAAFMLDDDWLNMARRERRRLIDTYAECLRANHWQGYEEGIQLLTQPPWLKEKTE